MLDSIENLTELPPGTDTLRVPLLGIDRMTVTAPEALAAESPEGWLAEAEPVAGSMNAAKRPKAKAVRASGFIFSSGSKGQRCCPDCEHRAGSHGLKYYLIV
jgi:hypothetical protein